MIGNETSRPKWYFRPFAIILLLFFVLGPFGLPFLFKSPAFNKTWKIILTAAVIVYTVYLLIVTIRLTSALYDVTRLQ